MSLRACGLAAMLALTLCTPQPAAGQEAAPSPAPAPALTNTPRAATPAFSTAPSSGGTFQLLIYFVLLVALLGGGVYVMRNGLGFLQPKPKGPRKLEIAETRMLGNRQFLIVAEYENRKMLIGVCPGRIDYLCTLSGAEPEFPRIASEEES